MNRYLRYMRYFASDFAYFKDLSDYIDCVENAQTERRDGSQ